MPTLAVLARTVCGCLNSAFLDISQHFTGHLFRPWIPTSARDIDGGPRRFTEVVLDEQSLPVASMESSRSEDATSATRAKTSLAAMAAVATRALILLSAHLALILLEFPSTYSARPHVPPTSQIVAGISAATASAPP